MNTDNTDRTIASIANIPKIAETEKPKTFEHRGKEEPQEISLGSLRTPLCSFVSFVVNGFWQSLEIIFDPRPSALIRGK
jgi:hypothetical protein